MKVIQASVDTIMLTMIVESMSEAKEIFIRDNSRLPIRKDGNMVFVDWTDDYSDEVYFEDVTNKRGIIQYESH
jgi:hypothetical protein